MKWTGGVWEVERWWVEGGGEKRELEEKQELAEARVGRWSEGGGGKEGRREGGREGKEVVEGGLARRVHSEKEIITPAKPTQG